VVRPAAPAGDGFGSLIVFFVVIVAVCVGIGVPIAFTFGIATMSYLSLTSAMPLSVVVNRMDEGMSNLLLLSVPMFVFLGLLMEMTGIARVMVAFLATLVGHVRGGLSYVLLGQCIWSPAFPARRRQIWLRSRRCCSGDAPARIASRRARSTAGQLQRDVGDDPAKPRAHHHRFGHQRVDHRAVHRRTATGGGSRGRTSCDELVPLALSRFQRRRACIAGPDRAHLRIAILDSPCRLSFALRSSMVSPFDRGFHCRRRLHRAARLLLYGNSTGAAYPLLVDTLSLTGLYADHRTATAMPGR